MLMMHSLILIRETLAEHDHAKASLEEKLWTVEELKATSKKAEKDKVRLEADLNEARRVKSREQDVQRE